MAANVFFFFGAGDDSSSGSVTISGGGGVRENILVGCSILRLNSTGNLWVCSLCDMAIAQ